MATELKNLQKAMRHHQAGELAEAERIYRRIVQINPRDATALHLLGVAAYQQGNLQTAMESIVRAIDIAPMTANFHGNLGLVLHKAGRFLDAIDRLTRALELQPDFTEAHNNLGNVYLEQGNYPAAVLSYQKAIQFSPKFVDAHSNLGVALQKLGQLEDSVIVLQQALQIQPNHVVGHYNLGISFQKLGRFDSAIQTFQHAVELHNDHIEAYYNLGLVCMDAGRYGDAMSALEQVILRQPNHAQALSNLGMIHQRLGQFDAAIECQRRAFEADPDSSEVGVALVHLLQHVCQWDDLEPLTQRTIAAFEQSMEVEARDFPSPFSFVTLPIPTTPAQQLQCARHWVSSTCPASIRHESWAVQQRASATTTSAVGTSNVAATLDRKIKLGYLSADFHGHATAWLIAELFEVHARDRFQVYAYSYGPDEDHPIRHRIQRGCDLFRDVREFDFLEIAQQIADDGVDILIDLKGFTRDARTPILAYRPAPIQVNYLGYPGTMGADFIDYIIVDDFIVPSDQQPYFAERLVPLPGCYQVNDSQREVSSVTPSRHECGLPEAAFVFCSFNSSYKITPQIFDVWMRLLIKVPSSVLWLLESSSMAQSNLRREAEFRGVAAERIVFAPKISSPDHLARHRLADLFLDSFPVNAHTTASDALQMGLPIVTLAGESLVSRVAGSLLQAVGMSRLIARRLEDYEAIALELAMDRLKLSALREELAQSIASSDLFKSRVFAKHLEKAYETMWQIHQTTSR